MARFKKIDHIGIAVPNLKEAIQIYKALLGKEPDHYEEVAEQKARTAFFAVDDTNLELLESTSPDGPIGKFLEKQGRGGLHHICIQVDNIGKVLEEYKRQGIQLIDEKPRIGAHGKKIAFVHPKSTGGVLVELSEEKK
ncbi:MAG: methylmalonyl-CoA epimerase [Deltaproteobacteria bacterium]|nr:methylmalonyl-CoA epimerase [Deltaproteobacteria bacterium]MBI2500349.1 methylmalonyl-CoA epimerase [Deltaproteobacteria bacterium]MBI4197212.1 methylmalonyl-CoA epimerase [Deltaproteobacteria bacterium]